MACVVDTAWIQARIDKTKLMIEAYEEAIFQLGTNNLASYSLDTGQTRMTVTKQSLGSLRLVLGQLEDRLQFLQSKLCGGAALYVRPGY